MPSESYAPVLPPPQVSMSLLGRLRVHLPLLLALSANSPFYSLRNVVLTPHAAGITPETTEAGLALAIENVLSFLNGQPLNAVV